MLLLAALLIGVLLGLLGGGGSVLAVPLLVYFQHLDAKTAIATALVMVGATSLLATIGHALRGRVCLKAGAVFASAGMLGSYSGSRLAAYVPDSLLMMIFAVVLLVTAVAMIRGRRERVGGAPLGAPLCPATIPVLALLLDGLLVGGVTGLVGAGGGFVVVPALNLLGGLPMHAAVGTSLFVLTLNSAAALVGYLQQVDVDPVLAGSLTAAAIVGSQFGARLSGRLGGPSLRRWFGLFVLLVGAYIIYREFTPELVQELHSLALDHLDFLLGVGSVLGIASVYRLLVWVHVRQPVPRQTRR
jgi:uncharacterized protein